MKKMMHWLLTVARGKKKMLPIEMQSTLSICRDVQTIYSYDCVYEYYLESEIEALAI